MSFPKNVGQVPLYYNKKNTGRPTSESNMVFYSHYTDVDNLPLYPFGFGLSYTEFKYTDLEISANEIHMDDTLLIKVKVQNIGKVTGDEIVQLYITDEFASVTPPVLELKGFKKIRLSPGESKLVDFILTKELLGFYNRYNEFITEPGSFIVSVGPNSEKLWKRKFWLKTQLK
jgi:beta-glucosidase